MNKEKLVNYLKKNKIAIIIGSIVVIGGYFLLHTNFSYHLEDRTGKYILNPDYYKFKEVEWTDLKTVYPTKLAYDPAWFKLPPEKYIPKEQPIPREISNISDPIIRRQAYFNFLCKTESVLYLTKEYDNKTEMLSKNSNEEEGILNLLGKTTISKIKNFKIPENNSNYFNYISSFTWNLDGNPFIDPIYKEPYFEMLEGHIYNFYGVDLKTNPKSPNFPMQDVLNNQFIEFMSQDGNIFKIEYDIKSKSFLPAVKLKKSTARYYALRRPINRNEMKNLGIYGFENIIYDTKSNVLVTYGKNFEIGAILPWKEDKAISNFSWTKINSCGTKPKIIDKF